MNKIPMNKEIFTSIASDFADTYPADQIFSESGWGSIFAFDLAQAIEVYAVENMEHYASVPIRKALSLPPVLFKEGMGFSYGDFLATTEQDDNDYVSAKLVYDAIVQKPEVLEEYLEALIWYCNQEKE